MRKEFDFVELEEQLVATLHGEKLKKWKEIGLLNQVRILKLVNEWNDYGMKEYHDEGMGFVIVWWMLDQKHPTYWLPDFECLDFDSICYMIHCDEDQHYI